MLEIERGHGRALLAPSSIIALPGGLGGCSFPLGDYYGCLAVGVRLTLAWADLGFAKLPTLLALQTCCPRLGAVVSTPTEHSQKFNLFSLAWKPQWEQLGSMLFPWSRVKH